MRAVPRFRSPVDESRAKADQAAHARRREASPLPLCGQKDKGFHVGKKPQSVTTAAEISTLVFLQSDLVLRTVAANRSLLSLRIIQSQKSTSCPRTRPQEAPRGQVRNSRARAQRGREGCSLSRRSLKV